MPAEYWREALRRASLAAAEAFGTVECSGTFVELFAIDVQGVHFDKLCSGRPLVLFDEVWCPRILPEQIVAFRTHAVKGSWHGIDLDAKLPAQIDLQITSSPLNAAKGSISQLGQQRLAEMERRRIAREALLPPQTPLRCFSAQAAEHFSSKMLDLFADSAKH